MYYAKVNSAFCEEISGKVSPAHCEEPVKTNAICEEASEKVNSALCDEPSKKFNEYEVHLL